VIIARESLYHARRPGEVVRRFSHKLNRNGLWLISMHDSVRNWLLWARILRHLVSVDRVTLRNDRGQRLNVRLLTARRRH
jgi:hypothetical protein